MEKTIEKYLFEQHGITDFIDMKQQLLEEIIQACQELCALEQFDQCMTVDQFVQKIYAETKLNNMFWLGSKKHFLGNDKIVNYMNKRCTKLNIFHLDFLRDRYWSLDSKETPSVHKGVVFEPECLQYGKVGEESLLKYLNNKNSDILYVSSGKLLLHSIPCIGATPDYLVFEREKMSERLHKMYAYVDLAKGIAEVKTTVTPENFTCSSDFFSEANLYDLLSPAIKNRHILTCLKHTLPDVFTINKKSGEAKVNWLTPHLLTQLRKSYEDSFKIIVQDISRNQTKTFDFQSLEKSIYVNFLTSNRGKQLLGQGLVFYDHRRTSIEHIELYIFYLYLNREDHFTLEYYVQINCVVPTIIFQHLELELNKKFYSDYHKLCLSAST
jgi:hypothetical protein